MSLWLDYLEFNQQHDQDVVQCNDAGIAKMRGLYERALAAASLHFVEGSKIWAAFCQYEISLLLNLQDASEEVYWFKSEVVLPCMCKGLFFLFHIVIWYVPEDKGQFAGQGKTGNLY